MAQARDEILDWMEQGRIAPQNLRAALEAGGALPSRDQWRGCLERLLLWEGTVFIAAGDGRVKFATNAFFFQEGHAKYYAGARYGEFRVAPSGELLLTHLRDEKLERLGPPRG